MGRRESAVVVVTRQCETLALWLREQRQRAGLTYTAMAARTSYTPSMLSRAASGRSVPSLSLVEAFTKACDGDLAKARKLWKGARWAHAKRRRTERRAARAEFHDLTVAYDRLLLVHPGMIEDYRQLVRAMVELRARSGQPSLLERQDKAGRTEGGGRRLPKSSLSAILRGEALPRRGHVIAFAEALGASRGAVAEWERAWERAARTAEPPWAPSPRPAGAAYRRVEQPEIRIRISPPTTRSDRVLRFRTAPPQPPGLWLDDLDRMRTRMPHPTPETLLLNVRLGPRRPNPPAGRTHAGLPIRNPRRYEPPSPQRHRRTHPLGPAHPDQPHPPLPNHTPAP
ncbi:helix-turn-helix domain-containing protein [Kitasatospora herbaricolor]|uniref:helix-turn-helix domain-containing protein n=1 Tax=Kitasatospora herbaricolor TaxID=68217 RepID=UPI0027D89875|nr:helix-turn-helix domain-containing protein [Kitasatospora herbaricolor]